MTFVEWTDEVRRIAEKRDRPYVTADVRFTLSRHAISGDSRCVDYSIYDSKLAGKSHTVKGRSPQEAIDMWVAKIAWNEPLDPDPAEALGEIE